MDKEEKKLHIENEILSLETKKLRIKAKQRKAKSVGQNTEIRGEIWSLKRMKHVDKS